MLETDVAEGEQRFLALAEAVDDLVFVTEPAGRMLWCNEAFTRETGYGVQDFWFDNPDNPFIHPDDIERVGGLLAAFVASSASRSEPIVNRFCDRWGHFASYRSRVAKVRYEGRDALVVVARRVGSEEPPHSSAVASYRALVEDASDGIVKLSSDGRAHFSNRRFQGLAGRSPVELAKIRFVELFVAEDRASVEQALARLAAGALRVHFSGRIDAGAGTGPEVEVNASLLTEGLDVGLVLAMVRDVTESRRLEARVSESQKIEGLAVLAGGVAHDFNNLMTVVLSNGSLLAKRLEGQPKLALALSDIVLAGERAAELSTALLAYVGQAPKVEEHVDLSHLLATTVPLVRPLAPRSVELNLEPPRGPSVVRGDRGQLSQIFLNLLTNGAQAIGDRPGTVRVSIDAIELEDAASDKGVWGSPEPVPGQYVRCRVQDDGVGMSADVRARVFDPFFTTKATGRGLGLSAVLGIVKSHGGAIRIDTEEGRGTTFEVLLPAAESRSASKPFAVGSSRLPRNGLVLFVDDEPTLQRLGGAILREEGMRVEVAADGREALQRLVELAADLVALVVDHTMPFASGDEVIRVARSRRPDLPIVYTTGFGRLPERSLAEDLVVLPKPYTPRQLVTALERAIAGR